MKKISTVNIVIYSFAALVVFLIFFFGAKGLQTSPGEKVASQGNAHIGSVDAPHEDYNTVPPTSGPHAGTAPWGISSVQLPDEMQIHNLEDGGVILHYDPSATSEEIAQLADIVKDYTHMILEPYVGMPSHMAVTAWTRIQYFDTVDEEAMRAFIERYEGLDHHVAY